MNGPEQAPLVLAQRAYRAAEPSVAEVQAGVRRARLALRRPRRSRSLLGKALVMVVLAMGGLAYAKPNALGELVDGALSWTKQGGASQSAARAAIAVLPPSPQAGGPAERSAPGAALPGVSASSSAAATASAAAAASAAATASAAPALGAAAASSAPAPANAAAPALGAAAASSAPAVRGEPRPLGAQRRHADKRGQRLPQSDADQTAAKWSRVGKALAQGDEPAALAALDALARSDDARTRDKAELGRAQLLLARGDRDGACVVARSLTQRQAGDRIERQALALLKSCSR